MQDGTKKRQIFSEPQELMYVEQMLWKKFETYYQQEMRYVMPTKYNDQARLGFRYLQGMNFDFDETLDILNWHAK